MLRLLRRTWRYTVAWLEGHLEEAADPEIQLEQAIEEAKRQHRLLVQQAASVIGNQHELELRLGRAIDRVERLRRSAREALRLADEARRAGDEQAADSYEEAAQSFAVALISTEAEMRDLKGLHDHAIEAAAVAKIAVATNAGDLRQQLVERMRLDSQLEQTKLQDRINEALAAMSPLAPDVGVPSLDRVRDRIERRYALALGIADVRATAAEVDPLQVQRATQGAEAARHLAALRSSLRQEGSGR
jgi:phage shock protein A